MMRDVYILYRLLTMDFWDRETGGTDVSGFLRDMIRFHIIADPSEWKTVDFHSRSEGSKGLSVVGW